jgi:sec-independent protein translocase protein TatA
MGRILEHPAQLLILLAIILVLFGGKKLPEAARGLGRSLRIFKSEVKEMQDEDQQRAAAKTPEPLEGRVLDADGRPSAPTPTDQRRDA